MCLISTVSCQNFSPLSLFRKFRKLTFLFDLEKTNFEKTKKHFFFKRVELKFDPAITFC